MANVDAELVEGLKGIAEGLDADGYTLDAHWTPEGRVEIIVGVTPDVCADCLVPKEVMKGITAITLSDAGIAVTENDVDLVYPEGSAAH